jgi:hypothetical protein
MAEISGEVGAQVLQVLQGMQGLGARMDRVEKWLERLGTELMQTRMEQEHMRMEMHQMRTDLGAEIRQVRGEVHQVREEVHQVRGEMREGLRQTNDRVERYTETLTLMISGLYRATWERFEQLERRST